MIKYNKALQDKLDINLKNYSFSYEISDKEIEDKLEEKKSWNTLGLMILIISIKIINFIINLMDISEYYKKKYYKEYLALFIIEIIYIILSVGLTPFFLANNNQIKIFYIIDPIVYLIILIFRIIKLVNLKQHVDLKNDIIVIILISIIEILLIFFIVYISIKKKVKKLIIQEINMSKEKIELDKDKKYILSKYKEFKINKFDIPKGFNNMDQIERINFFKKNEKRFIYSIEKDKMEIIKLINKKREEYNIDKLKYNFNENLYDYFLFDKHKKFFKFKNINKLDNKNYLFIYPKGEFKKILINNNRNIIKIILIDYLNYILILEKGNNEYILIYQKKDNPSNTIHIYYNRKDTDSLDQFN